MHRHPLYCLNSVYKITEQSCANWVSARTNLIMNRLTLEEPFKIVEIYFRNRSSFRETYKALRPFYGRHNRPSEQSIRSVMDKFRTISMDN